MRVVVAPDSFKGSLSAVAAAEAIASGVQAAFPDAEIDLIPLADGGEGTVEALLRSTAGARAGIEVEDPLGRPVRAEFGQLGQQTAVIEMAAASGLTLLDRTELNPFAASTFGTGQLVRAALDGGARELIICVGGSATVDGGAGALEALGARLLDAQDMPVQRGNAGLARLARVDLSNLDPRLARVNLRVATDVTNPLTGDSGAAAVFGPQKGASRSDIPRLDANLAWWARLLTESTGIDVAPMAGSGAAGGLAAAFMAIGAACESGIDLVLDACSFDSRIARVDLVLTGEGSLDEQTAHGKAISGLLRRTARRVVPVVALAGSVSSGALAALQPLGLCSAFAIGDGPATLDQSLPRSRELLAQTARSVIRLFWAGHLSGTEGIAGDV